MVPKYDASDSEIEKMINEICELLREGYSIAKNTQGLVDKNLKESIQKRGKMAMKPKQWEAYEQWNNGMLILPPWDWSKTETVEQAKPKLWTDKIEALRRVYKKNRVSVGQARAWIKHNCDLHPLMAAVAAMVHAERAVCGSNINKDLDLVAEQLACRRILQILRNRHSAKVPTDDRIVERINTFKDELHERSLSIVNRD